MLDFYFKKRLLGWSAPIPHVLLTVPLSSVPGRTLVLEYQEYGLEILQDEDLEEAYDRLKRPDEPCWRDLSEAEHFAIMDDFWEHDFTDGEILTYTHAAAKIQQRWETEGRPPLLQIDKQKRALLNDLLKGLGVPEGAWYACLHVREAGFHAKWNALYPSARDAEVDAYFLAIRTIRERGGWVIRVGDPTMKPLPAMDGVVDYVHSRLKNQVGDILLTAGCRFFVGTNSGYATIPGIYGVPNVLTNWVPVALPLWFGQDVMIPKLFYDRQAERFVDFGTLFSTRLGAIQNIEDFPEHIEIRGNTPEEINEAVVEMLGRLDGRLTYTPQGRGTAAAIFRPRLPPRQLPRVPDRAGVSTEI